MHIYRDCNLQRECRHFTEISLTFFKSVNGSSFPVLEELERPLTKQECFETLKTCSKGKCPGSDGFTVEFYQQFWSALGEEMVQSFNYASKHGHLKSECQ